MFAGCIEKKYKKNNLGEKLLRQLESGGLAGLPSCNKASWHGSFGDSATLTIVEQSIHHHESHEIEQYESILVAGWLRIDNKPELIQRLNISNDAPDRVIIIAAYEAWGDQLCTKIFGDFSFVIVDLLAEKCILCRDHMGVRPLYYYHDESCCIFSTSMAVLLALDSLKLTFSEQFVARYCSTISSDWTLTPYEQVHKLVPTNFCTISMEIIEMHHNVKMPLPAKTYFQFDAEKRLILDSEDEYIEQYRKYLNQAVECRVEDVDEVLACESSGGIDSSTISAIAANVLSSSKESLHAFGLLTESEEEECISMMSDFLQLKHTHLLKENQRDSQLIEKASKIFSDYSAMPITAAIAIVHMPIYCRAKELGAKVLLSGFGGDEFVTIYGATARVELFKKRQWAQWFSLFKGNALTKRLRAIKWLSRLFINQNTFETAKSLIAMKRYFYKQKVLKEDICLQYHIEETLTERSSYDAGCESVNEFSLGNRWSPDLVARLEDCSLAANSQGLEYRWPLLDVRLIEFFLSVPSEYKLQNGLPRYLHRRAIQGIVPEYLIWKDKSMGGPLVSLTAQIKSRVNDLYDPQVLQFNKLHPALQKIIDEPVWNEKVDQLQSIVDGSDNAMQSLLFVLYPVVTINEWLQASKIK